MKDGRLKLGKIFSVLVLVIQWNYLLYMLPTRTFWGFLFFFLILIAFFSGAISSMVESNAGDTVEVAAQANAINDMVSEMSLLLK